MALIIIPVLIISEGFISVDGKGFIGVTGICKVRKPGWREKDNDIAPVLATGLYCGTCFAVVVVEMLAYYRVLQQLPK